MNGGISIIVPTLRRPDMLRSALKSISSQSRLDVVTEVLVSENSDDTCSKDVCADFPHLPLRWINRSTTVSPYAHFRMLAPLAVAPWVAWHGDDDLWGRYHLQEAVRCLDAHPEAVGYVPGFAFVRNETCRPLVGTQQTVEGIIAGYHRELRDDMLIRPEQMFLETLVQVPFNFWSLVARKQETTLSLGRWHDESGWDADRLFFWDLCQRGPLIHSRETTMFHRSHPTSTSSGHVSSRAAWTKMSAEHTRQIIQEAEAAGMNPRQLWESAWAQMSGWQRDFFIINALPGTVETMRQCWGDQVCEAPRKSLLKHCARRLCPPLVWDTLHTLKRRLQPPVPGRPALHEKPAS